MPLYLGIEIGGTKLQIGLGSAEGTALVGFRRGAIDAAAGAEAIRRQIATLVPELLASAGVEKHGVARVGIGFGGPVDVTRGVTLLSNQVAGWEQFPICAWAEETLGVPAVVQNDADCAALAEATCGAGRGFDPVLYLTIGSGIGGGLIAGGRIYRGCGGAVEIGHLRPVGLPRHVPELPPGRTVEDIGSGFGITSRARAVVQNWHDARDFVLSQHAPGSPYRTSLDPAFQQRLHPGQARFARLWELAGRDLAGINTQRIAKAAREGDPLALELLADATSAVGWAIAQACTLLNPARVVIGGGVSLIGDELFFEPVRRACRTHIFPPFAGLAEIVPAELGEEMVVHGALACARNSDRSFSRDRP